MSETVYVVETGEYEQRYVFGVYVSLAAAVLSIKETYGAPYVVRWHDVEPGEDYSTLTGDFEAVQHHSTRHQAHFDITEMPLNGEPYRAAAAPEER